mmetsp:Transcript_3562/g.9704  ORF Transcript_3562/g.9704 Transcript_3562/m.9704 type:complete len:350 (+) Transcript_3562:82-1131(+)
MSVFCEEAVVLDYIGYNTEIFYDTQTDKVAEKLYSNDGEDASIPYSTSVDAAEKNRKMRKMEEEMGKESQSETEEEQVLTPVTQESDKAKEEHKREETDTTQWFDKCVPPPSDAEENVTSNLSFAIMKIERESKVKMLLITLHLRDGTPMKLRLREDATVADAMQQVVKQYSVENRSPPLRRPIEDAYHFYMAEGNGTPDTTFSLNGKSLLKKFGTNFCLIENPKFSEDKYRERTGSEPSRVVRPLLAIHLPNDLKTLVPYQPDLKISQLLIKICFKRGLDIGNHYLTTADSNTPLDHKMTVDKLGAKELYLRSGKDSRGMIANHSDEVEGTLKKREKTSFLKKKEKER